MKINKYLSLFIFVGASWSCIDLQSPAQSFALDVPVMNVRLTLAQNYDSSQRDTSVDINKDLRLRDISVTRDQVDKSLLSIEGSIDNHSNQSHYVYYIVAKFVSKDTALKQAIIPVNSQIEPGESAKFNHEISAESLNSVAPETIKSVVVKYEYR